MPTVEVFDMSRKKVEDLNLPDEVFGREVSSNVLQQVVRWQLAARRSGTASTKTRSEVRGGGRKPWRQKGTGRARAGTSRSPLWRSGGVVHGPKPRDFSYKLNKKIRRLGLKMALSAKVQDESLVVLSELSLAEVKTKEFAGMMKNLDLSRALFVTPEFDEKVELSGRNIPGVKFIRPEGLNVFDVLKAHQVVIVKPSVDRIVERLS